MLARRFNLNGTALGDDDVRLDDGDQDGGFVGLWHQLAPEDGELMFSQRGRRRAADSTAGTALEVANDALTLGAIGPMSVATDGNGLILAGSTVPEAVTHSENTEVVLRDGTATAVWFDQTVDGPSTLRAGSLTLSDGSVEPGPADEGGSSGGGGTTGLLTLLGLGLLARRRR